MGRRVNGGNKLKKGFLVRELIPMHNALSIVPIITPCRLVVGELSFSSLLLRTNPGTWLSTFCCFPLEGLSGVADIMVLVLRGKCFRIMSMCSDGIFHPIYIPQPRGWEKACCGALVRLWTNG